MKTIISPLNLLFLALLVTIPFSTNVSAQVAIPLSEINKEINIGEARYTFRIADEKVFVGTESGLFIINKDGTRFKVKENLVGLITEIKDVIGQTYVGISNNLPISTLCIIDKTEDKVKTIEGFDGYIRAIEVLEEQVFVGTEKGLFTINKDTLRSERVPGISGAVRKIEIVDKHLFVSTVETQQGALWIVKDAKNVKEVKGLKGTGEFTVINMVGELVFVGKSNGVKEQPALYVVSKDGENVEPVKDIKGDVRQIEIVGEKLFVALNPSGTDSVSSLWVVSKDGKNAKPVKGVREGIKVIKVIGELVFAGGSGLFGEESLWVVSKDGENIGPVKDIKGEVNTIEEVKGQILVGLSKNILLMSRGELWIISQDRKRVYSTLSFKEEISGGASIHQCGEYFWINRNKEFYVIYPNVEIKTELIENGWLTSILDTILPYNLISTGEHKVEAYYVDENGKDPFNGTVKGKFRFIKDESGVKPTETDFSWQEYFSYPITFGQNPVKYWVIDYWGNTLIPAPKVYYGIPSQYSLIVSPFILSVIFVLGCFAMAPQVGFAHAAIMNPWLRKYFSLGSVPLMLSVFPALRRHMLRRYSSTVSKDKELTEWKERFVYPDETFVPENFGKRLENERRLLFTGQSGIGKTSFFKHLTAYYVSKNKPKHPAKVFPVYISLTNYGGNSLEELVYTQLFSYGKITDRELAPMFLEQGGLLIFLDGVNEVQNVADRQKLSEFVEKFWTSNYICLSSQQSYPEIDNIPKVELKAFGPEKVREFIRHRVSDKERAERVIKSLADEDYQLYSVPRDLEFAVEILNSGASSLPKSRTGLYKIIFSSIFNRWKQSGNMDAEDTLCERAYRMIVEREMAFDSAEGPKFKEISEDLFKQKFLVKREGSYNFRHDLIRAYLASEFFYPRWENLFKELEGKPIDSNWLEMLKFSCENIHDSSEVKKLVYEVLGKSVRRDLVKSLFKWLKDNHPAKCSLWETDFYARYGESDFK